MTPPSAETTIAKSAQRGRSHFGVFRLLNFWLWCTVAPHCEKIVDSARGSHLMSNLLNERFIYIFEEVVKDMAGRENNI
jgi:hypothetical protein